MKYSFLIFLTSLQIISFAQTNTKTNTGSGVYYNPAQYQDYSTQLASNPVASYLANPTNYPYNYNPLMPYMQNGKPYLSFYFSFNEDLLKSCGITLPAKYITGKMIDAAIFIRKYYETLIQKVKQSSLSQKQKRKRVHNLRAQKKGLLTQIFQSKLGL